MVQRLEGSFTGSKDSEIFFQMWRVPQARGLVIVTHGLAEHSECYHPFAQVLNKFSWDVIAWDMKGHGRSSGKRGYIGDFGEYQSDLLTFIGQAQQTSENKNLPMVLFGHSMGGLVLLKTVLAHGDFGAKAIVLSSPALGLAVKVAKFKATLATHAAKWLPGLTLWNEIRYEDLSRDEEILKAYSADPLRHDKISPRIYLGMLEGFSEVATHAGQLKTPLLMQVAGNDRVVDSQAEIEFFEKAGSALKEIRIYPDSYHEIYNDIDRDRVFQDLKTFLNQIG